MCVDESGFSLIPTLPKTWAPRGQTPVLRHQMSWPKLSAIGAVAPNPHLWLHVVRGTVKSAQVVRLPLSAASREREPGGVDHAYPPSASRVQSVVRSSLSLVVHEARDGRIVPIAGGWALRVRSGLWGSLPSTSG